MTREECCAVVSEKEMPMTVYDMVAAMQEKFASRPAFRWVDDATTTVKEKTYGEYVADIRKMTGYLQENVADLKGQRIAILSRTNYEYGVVAFGTMMAGAVIVTLNQKKTWPELEYELGLSEPALIFTDGIDYGDGVRPKAGGERKSKDFYTVLILGRDTGGGGNTDTMLLASYDVTNQKATVMSIPRDTMVNVPWDVKKINSVYNYYGGGDKGIKALYKEISQLVGFEPDYQVVLEWDAVGEIVDAMGGVYYDVPRNMNYDDPYQDLHIHQTKRYRKLSGSDAIGFAAVACQRKCRFALRLRDTLGKQLRKGLFAEHLFQL